MLTNTESNLFTDNEINSLNSIESEKIDVSKSNDELSGMSQDEIIAEILELFDIDRENLKEREVIEEDECTFSVTFNRTNDEVFDIGYATYTDLEAPGFKERKLSVSKRKRKLN